MNSPDDVPELRAVIALLAEACFDADRTTNRNALRRQRAAFERRTNGNPMRPVAAALARSVAAGDRPGIGRHLSRPRSVAEWRDLALILAGAADSARLEIGEAA